MSGGINEIVERRNYAINRIERNMKTKKLNSKRFTSSAVHLAVERYRIQTQRKLPYVVRSNGDK